MSTLDFGAQEKPHKLFVDSPGGWVAYEQDGLVFTKTFPVLLRAEVAPEQAPLEIYYDRSNGFAELEVQGPYVAIAAGESSTLDVRWKTPWR